MKQKQKENVLDKVRKVIQRGLDSQDASERIKAAKLAMTLTDLELKQSTKLDSEALVSKSTLNFLRVLLSLQRYGISSESFDRILSQCRDCPKLRAIIGGNGQQAEDIQVDDIQ